MATRTMGVASMLMGVKGGHAGETDSVADFRTKSSRPPIPEERRTETHFHVERFPFCSEQSTGSSGGVYPERSLQEPPPAPPALCPSAGTGFAENSGTGEEPRSRCFPQRAAPQERNDGEELHKDGEELHNGFITYSSDVFTLQQTLSLHP